MNDIPVGICPNHGIVFGNDVEYNFPTPSECSECGEELPTTKMVNKTQVAAL